MALPILSPLDIQIGQLLTSVTVAIFVGSRFLPRRYHSIAGWTMTAGYLIGVTVLLAYIIFRQPGP